MYTKNNLKQTIEMKRQEMIKLAFSIGFTNKATVKCSQELDYLLNLYRNIDFKEAA
ncbi:aspartyl-phosphate phosphatase Spo0E family protein [Lentibacillus songyuanensis]|uniref:aspartyl-phosphate phosphatase Spo0E family protein n=1 Tax=Lentibacillus songyuanensis TaxID=3136161 RepID=UPI0031B9C0AF